MSRRGMLSKFMMGAAFAAVATLCQAAPPLLPPKPVVTNPRLYVLDCGMLTNDYPETFGLTRDEVSNTTLGDLCYLIVDPKGTLLWDTGLADHFVGRPLYENGSNRHVGALKFNTIVGQLADIGYSPDMIDFLSLSHSHYDHSGNANTFAGSTWLVSKQEWDFMFNQPAGSTPPRGVEDYARLKTAKTVFVPDHYDVFGDGVAIIHQAFGHTPGHSVLQVNLKNTGPILLVGDLYHYKEEMTLHRMPEHEKTTGTAESRAKIEALAAQLHAKIWITHDLDLYRTVRKEPAFYE